jgi:cytochrome c
MMPVVRAAIFAVGLALSATPAHAATAAGDPARGAQDFPVCRACHSVVPGRNMTGPSLAGIWGRKAGSLASFDRYSPALKASGIVWDERTLDAWLKDPAAVVPNNRMPFPGIKDDAARADLVAYLKAVSQGERVPGDKNVSTQPLFPPLRKLPASAHVTAIRHCRDSYHVTLGDGTTLAFWEPNLRFKTDSRATGPAADAPAILGAGSAGDRASVIFADPDEISRFIKEQC